LPGDRFDETAFPATGAAVKSMHELVSKGHERACLCVGLSKMVAGHCINFLARSGKSLSASSGLMASISEPGSRTNEDEAAQLRGAERTPPAGTRRMQEPDLLIVPNARHLDSALRPSANSTLCEVRNLTGIRSSFGEPGALFSTPAGTSSTEGGCPGLDPFRGSGCGAKWICNRLARLAKTVRFLAPLIAAVRCHSRSSRTRQVHFWLERESPAAQPTSPRRKRSRSSSIGFLKAAERNTRARR
jgi:hypothetical protein